ncbi:hypothetical protein AB0A95_19460 [Micromonospora sp. NPDC049230]|uniref:hypothetical protein n=1 Tax=Micromonospora sp. NPDC049230 TaxID=3155502 RepID=UPI0033D0E973
MGIFKRAPRSPFPDDMFGWLEVFGRYEFDAHGSGIDGGNLWQRVGQLYEYAMSDREGFLSGLRAIVATDQGGFATFGAARLTWEMYGGEALGIPAALPLIDGGIEFKRSRGLPTALLTGYEMQRIDQLRQQRG